MPLTKKNITRASNSRKKSKKPVIVTKSNLAAKETLFPKKIKQMNALLGKAKLLPL